MTSSFPWERKPYPKSYPLQASSSLTQAHRSPALKTHKSFVNPQQLPWVSLPVHICSPDSSNSSLPSFLPLSFPYFLFCFSSFLIFPYVLSSVLYKAEVDCANHSGLQFPSSALCKDCPRTLLSHHPSNFLEPSLLIPTMTIFFLSSSYTRRVV